MTAAVTSRENRRRSEAATLNRSLGDVLEQRGWGVGYATPERGRHCQAECYGERPGPVDRTRSSVRRGRPLPPRWPWESLRKTPWSLARLHIRAPSPGGHLLPRLTLQRTLPRHPNPPPSGIARGEGASE